MKNKKVTILFIITATSILISLVGFTAAYFSSSTDFENEFQAGLFQTTAIEVFESPDNWKPGQTIPKELTITNTGNVDAKARVCLEEEWVTRNNNNLPLTQNDENVAIINLANTSDWVKHGNCYEYKEVLVPDETTNSFISGVTFNIDTLPNLICTIEEENGSIAKTCESSGDGYDNATYRLTLRVETVQASGANELWSSVQYVNRQRPNIVSSGDEIKIGDEEFYVVRSEGEEVILLAKYNLLVGDIYDTYISNDVVNYSYVRTLSPSDEGYGLQSSEARGYYFNEDELTATFVGIVPFSSTNYWDDSVCEYTEATFHCTGTSHLKTGYYGLYSGHPYPNVYRSDIGNSIAPNINYEHVWGEVQNNGYTISYFVEEYARKIAEIGGFENVEGRLLTHEETIFFGCEELSETCKDLAPSWLYSSSYWLGSAIGSTFIKVIQSTGNYYEYEFFETEEYGVRPVLKILASELNINSGLEETLYSIVPEDRAIVVGNNLISNNDDILFYTEAYPCIKYVVRDGVVEESYIEFFVNDDTANNNDLNKGFYSLRGGGATYNEITSSYNFDSPYYEDNVATMKTLFDSSMCTQGDNYYVCETDYDHFHVYAGANGLVIGPFTNEWCRVDEDGKSYCSYGGPA